MVGPPGSGAEGPSEAEQAARKRERAAKRAEAKAAREASAARATSVAGGGLHFGPAPAEGAGGGGGAASKTPAKKKTAQKNDPRLVAAARELRDRWQEQVAARPGLLGSAGGGKYEVSRRLGCRDGIINGLEIDGDAARLVESIEVAEVKRLDAA